MFRHRPVVVLHCSGQEERGVSTICLNFLTRGFRSSITRRSQPRSARRKCVAPQPCFAKVRFERVAQFLGRQPRDVLLIEPVEFLGIENGIPTADAFEAEAAISSSRVKIS